MDVFMKENKHYSDVSFLVPLAALTLVGVVSIRTSQHVSSSHLVWSIDGTVQILEHSHSRFKT